MIISSDQAENEALLDVARLMVTAARTAPKGEGIDSIKTAIITNPEKKELSAKMEENGHIVDSKNVKNAGAVVLIGVKYRQEADLRWPFNEKLIDLGIAIGSAVKIASLLNIDNRIMYSIGLAAMKMGLLDADAIQGIPLSIKGKNIFFDRMKTFKA
jgi:uncharacterized ferredoxin-like protein